MAKSRARYLAELLNSEGFVRSDASALAGVDGVIDLEALPVLPNSQLEHSSVSIAGHTLSLGGSLTLDTADIGEHVSYKYYTDARARAAISASGDLSYDSTTGVVSFTERTDAEVRGLISVSGSLSYDSATGVVSYSTPTTIASLSNHSTTDLSEGTNLYYTTARFDTAFSGKSTTDLSEGTNLYYTTARFDTAFSGKSTTDLSEGTNLYYTTARFDTAFSGKSTTDLSEGTNLYYTTARFDTAFSGKSTTDLSEGTNLYYTTARANTDFDTRLATKSTTNLSEGTNLYYTDARARAAISVSGSLSYNSTTGVISYTTPTNVSSFTNDSAYITNATASLNADKITSGTLNHARIPSPVTNNWWNNGYVKVGTDGVMEVGKYLDFHTADSGGDADYDVRITAGSGTISVSGTISATGGNSTNWNTAYGWGDHSTQGYATQTYVSTAISNLVDSAPATLDTLNELAAALGDDPNFATTVSTSIGTKWTQDNTKISNWDTAYGWGNHASAGYLTSFDITTQTDSKYLRADTADQMQYNTTSGEMLTFVNATSGGKIQLGFQQNDTDGMHHRLYLKTWKGSATASGNVDFIVRGPGGSITSDVFALRSSDNNLSWRSNTIWNAGNDGSGSGLDADLLDGQHGSYYAPVSSLSNYLPLSGGVMTGSIKNNTDGAVIIESNTSEANNWLWKEAVKQWGIYYFNKGTESGATVGGYTTVGAEVFFTGSVGNGPAMPSTWTGYQSGSILNVMLSPYNGYIYSSSTVYAGSSMVVAGNSVWHAGNDGSGSGLDADLLDGQHGSYYAPVSSLGNYLPLSGGTLTGGLTGTTANFSGKVDFQGDAAIEGGSGYGVFKGYTGNNNHLITSRGIITGSTSSPSIIGGHETTFVEYCNTDSSGFVFKRSDTGTYTEIARVTRTGITSLGNTVWHAGNDGSGSGLDADLLDGFNTSASPTASTIPVRDANGDIAAREIVLSSGLSSSTPTVLVSMFPTTNQLVRTTPEAVRASMGAWTSGNDGSGSGLDADLLDGLQAADFKQDKWYSFTVGGDLDKFYPVLFTNPAGNYAPDIIEIYQPSVHAKGSSHGAVGVKIGVNITGWGNLVQHLMVQEYTRSGSNIYISKLRDVDHATSRIGVWLRGGNTTYYYRSDNGANLNGVYCTDNQPYKSYDSTNDAYDMTITYTTTVEDSFFSQASHTNGMNITTGNKSALGIWGSDNDGSGSGLDADLLDGIDSGSFARSDANDTLSGQYTFTKTNDHAIKVGTIRGTAVGSQSGEYIHMYNRVHIGGPNGWGASDAGAPTYGLSTYGGANLATATGSVTIGGNTAWHAGNDGSGSGLDADTVDGQQPSALSVNYANTAGSAPANGGTATALNGSNYISRSGSSGNYNTDFNNTPAGTVRHQGDDANITNNPGGTWWFVDNYRHSNGSNYWGTQVAWGWEDNANKLAQRNITGGNWSGWVYYWNTGNDGSGSGLDADLLDGQHGSYYQPASTAITTSNIGSQSVASAAAIDGIGFRNGNSTNGTSPDNIPENGTNYVNSISLYGQTDGALYSQAYSTSWVHQIYGDYRTGNIAVRGRNNGTWQSWKTIWSSANDGSGSGLDADMVDGIQGSNIAQLNANQTFTSNTIKYFQVDRGGYCGSLDTANLQAYSSSNNSAYMSFHKGGHYAVNMGLDADNVLRIGGWSASANRWVLDMSGNMTAAGNVTAYSDIRLKENIKVIPDALEKVQKIRGVTFTRNDQEDKEKLHTGVIAQEVEAVLPEVISEDNLGIKNVAYGNMVGLLIEAIKELKAEVEDLKSQLKEK